MLICLGQGLERSLVLMVSMASDNCNAKAPRSLRSSANDLAACARTAQRRVRTRATTWRETV